MSKSNPVAKEPQEHGRRGVIRRCALKCPFALIERAESPGEKHDGPETGLFLERQQWREKGERERRERAGERTSQSSVNLLASNTWPDTVSSERQRERRRRRS